MSLLGIDVGTTGCKSAVFSEKGQLLALSYQEYDHQHPNPGWAELDSCDVWNKTKQTIVEVTQTSGIGPIKSLSVTSLGEAMVPVSENRNVLGPSILNYCVRGSEFYDRLEVSLPAEKLYEITGNTLATHFSIAKLMWIKEHQPEFYNSVDFFLPWTSFISFMLGAEPFVDYSLANRTLLFDINQCDWSESLLDIAGINKNKLPVPAEAGTVIGSVSKKIASELGLSEGLPIILGAHDQCANAVGSGVIRPGQGMLGLGSFTCAVPVFNKKLDSLWMISRGINTEHHAVPNLFVSFIYNQGGSVVKWFRDTFASFEHRVALETGDDIYKKLFSEIPDEPSKQIILPYFSMTGLPDFSALTSGVITGLRLSSTRGDILRGIAEGIIFDLKVTFDHLSEIGFGINELIVVGGGSKSQSWVQICADILGVKMMRPKIIESGTLGSAIIAGVGSGVFSNYSQAIETMVSLDEEILPNEDNHIAYKSNFDLFLKLREQLDGFLKNLSEIR